jgi:hypothetical protein
VVLLVGVATSIDMFHERLPRSALRWLKGQSFDVAKSEDIIERVYECSAANEDVVLRIGAGLSDAILQRQRDHVQGVEAFEAALKVNQHRLECFRASLIQPIVRVHESLPRQPAQHFPRRGR